MAFEKGKEKTGGRKIGSTNKTTKELRNLLRGIYDDEMTNIPELLEQLNPKERLDFIVKVLPYILPKVDGVEANYGEHKWDFSFD